MASHTTHVAMTSSEMQRGVFRPQHFSTNRRSALEQATGEQVIPCMFIRLRVTYKPSMERRAPRTSIRCQHEQGQARLVGLIDIHFSAVDQSQHRIGVSFVREGKRILIGVHDQRNHSSG